MKEKSLDATRTLYPPSVHNFNPLFLREKGNRVKIFCRVESQQNHKCSNL